MKSQSSDSWAGLLQVELAKKGTLPPGPGWKTFVELVESQKVCEFALRKAIRGLRAKGMIEVFSGAVVQDGMAKRQVWYRPVAKGGRK